MPKARLASTIIALAYRKYRNPALVSTPPKRGDGQQMSQSQSSSPLSINSSTSLWIEVFGEEHTQVPPGQQANDQSVADTCHR